MNLANLITDRKIILDLKADTKEKAVDELLGLMKTEGVDLDYDLIKKSIGAREEIEDTSYGHGFAFPHARTDAVRELYVLIGISKKGLVDKTPDKTPLHVVCLLLTPSTIAKLYLQTLSGIATFARTEGILSQLLEVKEKTEVIKLIYDTNVIVDKELMVKDIMRHNVATITLEQSLKEAANEMFKHRLSLLAVVNEDGKLIGVINDKDMIKAAMPDFKSLISNLNYFMDSEPFEELLKKEDKIQVSQLYRDEFETTTPDSRIVEVAAMMIFKDIKRVFVISDGALKGILLRKDIVSMIIRG